MQGAGVLYNTCWIRFGRGQTTFDQAVKNTEVLFDAAADAGVGRVVHFSVANASEESRLPYFRGKEQVEEMLKASGMSCAIIRPTLVFGEGDLLLNNMAWAPRRFPLFPVFGRGNYRVQPIYAGDLAAQAVAAGSGSDNFVADAAGPDTFTFEELLRLLAEAVNARVRGELVLVGQLPAVPGADGSGGGAVGGDGQDNRHIGIGVRRYGDPPADVAALGQPLGLDDRAVGYAEGVVPQGQVADG